MRRAGWWLILTDHYSYPRNFAALEAGGDGGADPVIAAELVAHADHDCPGPGHWCVTVSRRKWMEQEMHRS
jgi:hypothetical protein